MSEIELQIVTRVLTGPLDRERAESPWTVGSRWRTRRATRMVAMSEVPGLAAPETGLPTTGAGHV
jgi:hypothetical protein